jgi:hypothetical protein
LHGRFNIRTRSVTPPVRGLTGWSDSVFKTLSDVEANILVAAFGYKEIRQAVWDCNSFKSSGQLDGVNFDFIKEFWHDI